MITRKFISGLMSATILAGVPAYAAPENEEMQDDIEEVVVYGTALQSRRSIDRKRANKQFSDIVGIDALGKLPDSNVAEAASRLPGLSVVRDQQTGEGSLLSVRGLDSTLNTYSVNGVRMGTSNPDNRAVSLQVLPPDGVKLIEVKKTLTPDLDGDALGGAVNIILPDAFDFDGLHASLNADLNYHERSEKIGKIFSASLSNIFNENLGVYVGAYYGRKDSVAEETENEGDWLTYNWVPDSNEYVDERSYQMQGLGLDLFENDLERWGVNVSVDYKYGDDNSFHVRGQHNKYTDVQIHNWLDVRNQSTDRLAQVDPNQRNLTGPLTNVTGFDAVLGNIYGYTTGQIVDADNDGIITDADRTEGSLYSLFGRSGTWDPEGLRLWRGVEYEKEEQTQSTITFGGEHHFENLVVDFDLSYAKAQTNRPISEGIEAGFEQESPWLGNKGVYFSFPDPRYPQWQLNEQGLNGLTDLANFPLDDAWAESYHSEDERKTAQINLAYTPTWDSMRAIKFGIKRTVSDRSFNEADVANLDINGALTLADTPELIGDAYTEFFDGEYAGFQSFGFILDGEKVSNAVQSCDPAYFTNGGSGCTYNPDAVSQTDFVGLKEDIWATYLMGEWEFGGNNEWEVIAGVRYERTHVKSKANRSTSIPGQDDVDEFVEGSNTYSNILPSVHVLYHVGENIIWRGAIWSSFTRPEFDYIAGGSSYSYDEIDGVVRLTGISRRNIDLKPQKATNFDFGFEYYLGNNTGLVSVNLYYKDIRDFLVVDKRNTETTSSQGIDISEPKNLDKARLMGIELGYSQHFSFLPKPFDGLGMIANMTFQDSEGDTVDNWRTDRAPFVNAPNQIYNFILYYEKAGWEGRLSYQYTGRYLEDPRGNGVDKYIQPTQFLDFTLSYFWTEQNIKVTLQAKNLLEEHLYWATRGTVNGYQKDYVEAGRTFNMGVSWSF